MCRKPAGQLQMLRLRLQGIVQQPTCSTKSGRGLAGGLKAAHGCCLGLFPASTIHPGGGNVSELTWELLFSVLGCSDLRNNWDNPDRDEACLQLGPSDAHQRRMVSAAAAKTGRDERPLAMVLLHAALAGYNVSYSAVKDFESQMPGCSVLALAVVGRMLGLCTCFISVYRGCAMHVCAGRFATLRELILPAPRPTSQR